jgi:RNA polymerase sigma factor (sigma-70 family)
LTGNNWEAEDLVQDSLVRVLDRLKAEPGLSLSKSYVMRVARNLWIDRYRKQRRQPTVPYDELVPSHTAITADDSLVTRELLEQLMHRLLPKPFVIVLLSDVFQLTAKETASCINMEEGAVQVALSRARKRLKQLALRGDDSESSPMISQRPKEANNFMQLLESVMDAFRRHDPYLIHDAYVRLFESGSHLALLRTQAGQLYFTFRDPNGNLLMVTG